MEGGWFYYNGANYAVAMTQTVGALTLAGGPSTITVYRNNGTPQLVFDNLSQTSGAYINFWYGGVVLGSAAVNAPKVLFSTPPDVVGGGGAAGSKTMSILPGARSGDNLVVYDVYGIRALLAAEYNAVAGNDINGAGATENVKISLTTPIAVPALTANRTINSLTFTPGANLTWAMGNTLTLTSGQLLSATVNSSRNITSGKLTAGSGSATDLNITVMQNTFTIGTSSTITNNGAGVITLVKSGAGTLTLANTAVDNPYSGGTFVNEGLLNTSATANRHFLGTGPVRVDNAGLSLGHVGATANASGADYTVVNAGYVFVPNYAFTSNDTFDIGPNSIVYSTAVGAGLGLNSLDRGVGGSAFTNIVLASDAIIGQPALATAFNRDLGTIKNLGTNADLYYGLGVAQGNALGSIEIGHGTPFKGISTMRGAVAWNLGTINVAAGTSNIYLQGLGVPGVAPAILTLGNYAQTAGGAVLNPAEAGTLNVNVVGTVSLWDDSSVFGDTGAGKHVHFVVKPGALLQLYDANAMGSGSGIATTTVQSGGTLSMLNNPAGINGATTIQRGGRLWANHVGGLIGTGALSFERGSIIDIITAVTGFSGSQAAAATIPPGVIVRLSMSNIGSPVEPLDAYLADKAPIYEIYGANYWVVNPATAGTTILTLNRSTNGVGGMLVNDFLNRSIPEVYNGKIVIGPNGGVIAATTNTILTLPQRIEMGTNELVIGHAESLDGSPPRLGTVSLTAIAGYNTAEPGSRITIIPGAKLNIGAVNTLPDLADVSVDGILTVGAISTVGSLAGSGTVNVNAALTVGRNGVSTNFAGRLVGASAITKSGDGRWDVTESNLWTGAVIVNRGIFGLSGNGKLRNTGVAFTVADGGTFLLDNSDVNEGNRLVGAAPGVTFQGGTFRFIGKDGEASSESLGVATIAGGYSTIDIVNGSGAGSSAQVTFSALTAGAGSLNLTAANGTLGSAGDNPRVFFTGQANNSLLANVTAGTAPAFYTTATGARAYTVGEGTEFNGAVVQTGINTVFTSANTSPMELLTAARTVNSLWINSPGGGKFINLNSSGAYTLTITSGRLILGGSDDFEIKRSGTSAGLLTSGARLLMLVDNGRVLTVSVPIAISTTKEGPGTLELNAANTMTGVMTINEGLVRYGANGDLAATMPLTIWQSGQFDLAGKTDTIAAALIYSGGITNSVAGGNLTITTLTLGSGPAGSQAYAKTGSGTLTLGGNVVYNVVNDPGMAVIDGNLALNGATRTFTVADSVHSNAASDLNIPAIISGAAGYGIIKAGTGLMRLGGSNIFNGPVSVNAGILRLSNPQALGTPGANRTLAVAASASLMFDGENGDIDVSDYYTPITLNGTGNRLVGPISGVLVNQSGSNSVPGAITLAAASQIASLAGKLTLNGNITAANLALTLYGEGNTELGGALGLGSGALYKYGGGTLTLSGAGNNAFTGGTVIYGGKLALNKSGTAYAINSGLISIYSGGILQYAASSANNNLINTAAMNIYGTGQFDFNGASDTIGNLGIVSGTYASGDSVPLTNSAGGGTLTIGTLAITPVSGYITTLDTGTGTLKLGGNVTFTANGTGRARIGGNLDLGAVNRTFTIGDGTHPNHDMLVDANISASGGAYGIVKATAWSRLVLTGTNTYTGLTTLGGGILRGQGNTNVFGRSTAANALTLATATTFLELAGDMGLNFGRNATVGAAMQITSDRVTPGAGTTHQLGALTIGAFTMTVAAGTNVTSGIAGVTFTNATLTGNAGFAVNNPVAGGTTRLTIDGPVGESGGVRTLVKSGVGELKFTGSTPNTRSGLLTVSVGSLLLDKSVDVNAIANGGLTIGAANTNRAVVMYTGDSTDMIGSGAVTINGQGRLDFNGKTDTIGNVVVAANGAGSDTIALTNTAGGGGLTVGTLTVTPQTGYLTTLDTGTGLLTLGGNMTFGAAGTGRAKLSGNVDLGAANRTFTIANGTHPDYDMLVDANLSSSAGDYGVIKATAASTLVLSGTNTYTGLTTLSGGILRGQGNTNVFGRSTAANALALTTASTFLELAGDTGLNFGRNATVSAAMQIASDRVTPGAGVSHTLGALTIGAFALTVNGGSNVNAGVAEVVFTNTTLTGNATFTVNQPANGGIARLALQGEIGESGARTLIKNGVGILRIAGTNTCSGATTVSAGTLEVLGAMNRTVSITVNGAGATLAGTGIISNAVTITNGKVTPGEAGANSGILTIKGNYSQANANADLTIDIGGPTVGTGYDQLAVSGAITLGAGLGTLTVNSAYTPVSGDQFIIVRNDAAGAVSGTFSGLAEGATVIVDGQNCTITYVGGDGNDIVLIAPITFRSWDGGSLMNSNWTTPENWISDTAPGAGAGLIFIGPARFNNVNNFAAYAPFAQLAFTNTPASFTLSGNAITLRGDIINYSDFAHTINLGLRLAGFPSIAAIGGDLMLGGRIDDDGAGYGIVVNGARIVTVTNDNAYLGPTVLGGGTLRVQGHTNALGLGTGADALTLNGAGSELHLVGDTGMNFGRNTLVGATMRISGDRATPGAGVTHRLGTLSIGAYTVTAAGGTNVNSGVAGLTFGDSTLTGSAGLAVSNPVAGGTMLLTIDGALDGAFALTKVGAGTLKLAGGTAPNTRSGLMTVSDGTLRLDKSGSAQAIANGGLTIGTASTNRALVLYTGDSTDMMGTGTLTINGQSRLDVDGKSDEIGNVAIVSTGAGGDTVAITNTAGGGTLTIGTLGITPLTGYLTTIDSGTGMLTLGGNLTLTAAGSGWAKIKGHLDLGVANRTFTINNGTYADDLVADAPMTSASGASVIKAGAGTMIMSATNTFTGSLTNTAGVLTLTSSNSFGGIGKTVTQVGGTLNINHASSLGDAANTFIINGGTINNVSGLPMTLAYDYALQWGGSFTFAGSSALDLGRAPLILAGNCIPTITASSLTVNGGVSGAFNFGKAGAGILNLWGTNTFGGAGKTFTLSAGTLNFNHDQVFGDAANTLIFTGGTFNNTTNGPETLAYDYTQTWGGSFTFGGNRPLYLGAGPVTLSANSTVTVVTNILTVAGPISGAPYLAKAGEGVLELTGTNDYTGITYISYGVLRADEGIGFPANSALYLNYNGTVGPNCLETSGTFTRNIGTSAGEVYWSFSGGFAARGGPLTVNLEGGATLNWTDANTGFRSQYLLLGSRSATDVVTLENDIDMRLNRNIYVFDNPASTSDYARLTGVLANGDATARGLNKLADGVLEMTAKSTYSGFTRIFLGELRMNGTITNANHLTTVSYSTTPSILSGTGMVGQLTVNALGTVAPGHNGAGPLRTTGNTIFNNNSTFECDLGQWTNDTVHVGGNLSLNSTWTLRLKDDGGVAVLSDEFTIFTYAGWMAVTPGTCLLDLSPLDPALWETNNVQVIHDGVLKRVYVTGLRYKGVTLSIGDAVVEEGNGGTTNMVFTVTASGGTNATVNFSSVNGTAVSGSDYVATNGVITFTPAITSRVFTVVVNGDTDDEWPSEQFHVSLLTPTNARLGRLRATGYIADEDSGMLYWMKIRVPGHTGGVLNNFPVAVKLNESLDGFNYDQFLSVTGGDLRFVNSNRTVLLNHEIERWDRLGDSAVWVQLPRIEGTNTWFWAYWGDPARATAPAYTTNGSTWTENFLAVWHLNATNAAGSFMDSTANRFDGVNQGCIDAAGVTGGGQDFAGLQRINITGVNYAPTVPVQRLFTIQYCFKGVDTTANLYLIDIQTGRLITGLNTPEAGRIGYYNTAWVGGLGSGLNDGSWHHAAYTFDGGATTCWVYVDGELAGALPYTGTYAINGNARIGSDYNGAGNYFEGLMDEVRMCKGMRSADWIRATWANQQPGSTFVAIDSVASSATGLAIRNRSVSSVTPYSATLNGFLLRDGGELPKVYVCWGTVDGGTSTSTWQHVEYLGNTFASLDSFSTNLSGLLPQTTYRYRAFATNSAEGVWAPSLEVFQTRGVWYVATNGSHGAATNWATARTNLQSALTSASVNDYIYIAGHQFVVRDQILWTNSGLRVMGGYEGVGQPGSNNPALWKTQFARPTSSTNRIFYVKGVNNGYLHGVTITNGYRVGAGSGAAVGGTNWSNYGGGLFVLNCQSMTISNCIIRNNRIYMTAGNGYWVYGGGMFMATSSVTVANSDISYNRANTISVSTHARSGGGGIAALASTLVIRDCTFVTNIAQADYGVGHAYGGSLCLDDTDAEISNTVITRSDVYGSPNDKGDGVYVGPLSDATFRNCLITRNGGASGTGGIYLDGGFTRVENCTLAYNTSYGIYRNSGAATVRNSILWENGDDIYQNVVGNVSLYYSTIQDGDNNILDGCTDADPWFSDTETFHLASMYGHYTNGYFSGGSWTTASVNSAVIDLGDPDDDISQEPPPNGGRINMGAYGNTPVASKSHPLQVSNLAPSGISPTGGTLRGRIDHIGSRGVRVWFYWGLSDGAGDTGAWASNVYVGEYHSPTSFWSVLTGLQVNSNYYYRVYATNSGGAVAWAAPSTGFTAAVYAPEIESRGVLNDGTALVTLQGEVTSAGGDNPKVYVCWGLTDAGMSTAAWDQVEYLGILDGTFSTNIATVAGENYFYRCYATNVAGDAWSDPATDFGTYKMIYVATNAAGLGTGESWLNAFTTLDAAVAACSLTKTNRIHLKGGAGGSFVIFNQVELSRSKVILRGGYEGIGWPGARNTTAWPTILRRFPASSTRILCVQNATNVVIDGFTITAGFTDANGAGVAILSSTNVVLSGCIISNNTLSASTLNSYGGGVYASQSYGVISNCWIGRNRMQAIAAGYRLYGAGIHLAGGRLEVLDVVLFYNTARSSGTGAYCYGGGLSVANGTHTVRNGLVVQNYCWGTADTPVNSQGDGVYHSAGDLTLENCTIAGNKGEGVRGIAGTTIRDSILWRNERDVTNSAVVTTMNCNIGNGERVGINGNILVNPRFEMGFYLAAGSLCRDAGSRTVGDAGLTGKTTMTNATADTGTVDLGYHYSGVHPLPDLYVSTAGTNTNAGTSWATAFRTVGRALSAADIGTRIHVATGVYDVAGGETFPLVFDTAGVLLVGTNRDNTVLYAPGTPTQIRVMDIPDLSFGTLEALKIQNGYYSIGGWLEYGAGVNVLNATDVQFVNCVVVSNILNGGANAQPRGVGMSFRASSAVIKDSVIEHNRSTVNPGPWNGTIQGGGIYVTGGNVDLARTVVRHNRTYLNSYQTQQGAGLALIGGPHSMTNCLVFGNNCTGNANDHDGDGIYANGTVKLENCTVAYNGTNATAPGGGDGLWAFGDVLVTNCLFWGNNNDLDEDVVGSIRLYYSSTENGDNEGVQGCVRVNDPLFVDKTYFHLRSTYGQYINGFFDGGTWTNDASTNSYLIDRCNPDVEPAGEGSPNGAVVNMGAYGNTAVASRSQSLTVTNRLVNGVSTNTATLNGRLVCVGDPRVHVWFYYGPTDGTNNPAAWATNTYVGLFTGAADLSKSIFGLSSNVTYYYRVYASNSFGTVAWAAPSFSFVAEQSGPEVETRGVVNEGGPLVTLKGEITSTGGDDPYVFVCWGVGNGGTSTAAWDRVERLGVQLGTFETNVTIDVRSNYWYNCFATNRFGVDWGDAISFGRNRVRYVKKSATGLNTGLNWTDAYTDLQGALDNVAQGRTNILYMAGTYTIPAELSWTNSNIQLKGGYQGVSGYPGNWNPDQWPTVISNIAAPIRVMSLNQLTNCAIENLTIAGGKGDVNGGGLYIVRCTNLLLNGVTISFNSANDVGTYTLGGGVFASNTYGIVSNCWFEQNFVRSFQNTRQNYGGGLYIRNGAIHIRDTGFYFNKAESKGTGGTAFGGGLYIQDGIHSVKNALFVQNYSRGANDTVTYSRGDGIVVAGTTPVDFQNCTIAGNKGEGLRGNSNTVISNSIVWANFNDITNVPFANISYCNVQDGDGAGMAGNFRADPAFERLCYLSTTSACINAGGATAASLGLTSTYFTRTDGIGDSGMVDLGFHYRQTPDKRWSDFYVSLTGSDANVGTNSLVPFRTLTHALLRSRPGTYIHVGDGTFTTNLAQSAESMPLYVRHGGVWIIGNGPSKTRIEGPGYPSRTQVIMVMDSAFGRLSNLRIANGYRYNDNGAGVIISNAAGYEIYGCEVVSNYLDGGANSYTYGAGIYGLMSNVEIYDSLISTNTSYQNAGPWAGQLYGGGIYVQDGEWRIRRSIISRNQPWSGNTSSYEGAARGAGIYFMRGTHDLENCLIVQNSTAGSATPPHRGDGIFGSNAVFRLLNCTVADNGMNNPSAGCGDGIFVAGGSASLTNCILWGQTVDLRNVGTDNVYYSVIQSGFNNGTNDCSMVDPDFVDRTYYHVTSIVGQYEGGYFKGGTWQTNAVMSPLIDAGDPARVFNREPSPNGGRVNIGAYGNSPTASRSGLEPLFGSMYILY